VIPGCNLHRNFSVERGSYGLDLWS